MKFARTLILLTLVCLASQMLLAEGEPYFLFTPGVRLWGADFLLGLGNFPFPGIFGGESQLYTILGGGWEGYGYYRQNGAPFVPGTDATVSPTFNRVNFSWTVGFSQLFLFDPAIKRNVIELFLLYKGRYETYDQTASVNGVQVPTLIAQSGLPDSTGIFMNSFVVGVGYRGIVLNEKTRSKNGLEGELSFEYAPAFLNPTANFMRFTLKGFGFYTLVDSDEFTLFVAERFITDVIPPVSSFGGYIPYCAMMSVGGKKLDDGIGSGIRGIEWCRYDGTLKVYNNIELRAYLPTLFGQSYVITGLIAFFDIGGSDYANLDYTIPVDSLQYSTGLGITFTVLGIDLISFYGLYDFKAGALEFAYEFAVHF